MKIGLLTGRLSAAAGGLASSVPNLAHLLGSSDDAEVEIFGVEDPQNPDAAADWAEHVHAAKAYGPKAFHYAPEIVRKLRAFAPDITDVQGLWTYPSLANFNHHRATGTPYLVTPRGMLDPWARDRSALRKRIVRLWFEDAHLRAAACLRATAEMEAEHFRSFGLTNPIAIVPNGVEIPTLLARPRSKSGRRRLLFLSRIHPKKGLQLLLNAWGAIEASRPEWDLVIAGPDELNHTIEMQSLARRLGLSRVKWQGPVHGADKTALYRSADLFILPTHGENFGLVVAEALAHEIPVITTRNAPWAGLETHGCGWWIPLEDQGLRNTMILATAQPAETLHQMGAKGRSWVTRDFGLDQVAVKMLEVYRWVATGGAPPLTVQR
ncbi:glycosyltransferase [Tropicimonas sediminicola]|uniref:Glycosyltransferase involved in cell wall bisynthesis n=1 Tax=Tropicimonas sediminicola TaxID=1031541 RepID=A0A239M291_9RHOB|nr:glycosyltransferase [Tropicimonas sediminicola]SNT36836.1 Glycosyltransferase involved in cell wall bisynthesis [Tropicimonas sediminicola]